MINNFTIFLCLTFLCIAQSYPNDQANHLTKCVEPKIVPGNLISFLTLLRQIQRAIDQTKQSFNDVVRQNQYWIARKPNGEEIIDKKCIDITNIERTKFANFVMEHENEFENCADQLIEQYEKSEFTSDLNILENDALKCISILRQTKFWAEYQILKRNFSTVCTAKD